MSKKTFLAVSFITFMVVSPGISYAKEGNKLRPTSKSERFEIRNEFKSRFQSLKEDFQQKIYTLRSKTARIAGGEITAINGSVLTIIKDGKTYTVNTDSKTQFQRNYWGKSSLTEFSVDDKVNVTGKFTDENNSVILAKMIRNLSILKRHGVFLGDITAKNSDNFIINSKNRGNQTVYFSSTTKFVKRNETAMTYAEMKVGDRVRVKGVWDKSTNKILETIHVKDYDLPIRPVTTVKPTKSVKPTKTIRPTRSVTFIPTLTPTNTLTPTP